MPTRITSWQLEIALVTADLERRAQTRALDVLKRGVRDTRLPSDLHVERANPADPRDYLLVVNDVEEGGFRFELHRDKLLYLHVAGGGGGRAGAEGILTHFDLVARPLMTSLWSRDSLDLGARCVRVAASCEVRIDTKTKQNKRGFLRLAGRDRTGTRGLPFDAKGSLVTPDALGPRVLRRARLERVNLRLDMSCTVSPARGKGLLPAQVMIEAVSPLNDDESWIEARVGIQSSAKAVGKSFPDWLGAWFVDNIVGPLLVGGGLLHRLENGDGR